MNLFVLIDPVISMSCAVACSHPFWGEGEVPRVLFFHSCILLESWPGKANS
jgi:hypothetical protein